jgi:hypothetical protein
MAIQISCKPSKIVQHTNTYSAFAVIDCYQMKLEPPTQIQTVQHPLTTKPPKSIRTRQQPLSLLQPGCMYIKCSPHVSELSSAW